MGVNFISIALTVLVFKGIHCDVQFQYDSEQCLGQSVEYQCIVNGSGNLEWTILDEDGGTLGTVIYSSGGSGVLTIIKGVFSVDQLQGSPSIISNISFTVQSSINGYTISCAGTAVNENLIIDIKGPPNPPIDISMYIGNDLNVTWTPPSFTSQCVMISSYNIYIIPYTTNSIITTTDTSVDIPLAGLSPGIYCVSVATVDTANRTGNYSNQECVTLEVPSCANVSCDYYSHSLAESAICQLNWEYNSSFVPPLQWVYIYNNVTGDTTRVSGNLEYDQIIIMRDTYYMFSVFGENVLGNGTACNSSEVTIFVDLQESLSVSSATPRMSSTTTFTHPYTMTATTASSSMVMPTSSITPPPENGGGSPYIPVVITICVLIFILILILILLTCLFYIKRKMRRDRGVEPEKSQNKESSTVVSTNTYNDVFGTKKDGKAVSSSGKSTKKESPPRPQPYKGNGGPPSQVSYSSGRQELHYVEMSHHTPSHGAGRPGGGGGGGSKFRSPPMQGVTYSDIKHR